MDDANVPNKQTEEFLNLETLIKNYAQKIEELRREVKKQKDLLDDSFESDAVYKEHEEKAKDAARVKSATKMQILKQPTLIELSEKIEDLRTQIKDSENSLSDYLIQYQKLTGFNEIEVGDGETLLIVNKAKLVKGVAKE